MEQNMTVNRLPVRTWNRLKINERVLTVSPPEHFCVPEPDFLAGGLAWRRRAPEEPDWENVETGMGPDMERWFRDVPTWVLEAAPGYPDERPVTIALPCQGNAAGRVYIRAGENSRLTVAVLPEGREARAASVQVKILAESGAVVRLAVVPMLENGPQVMTDIGCVCRDNARLELVQLETGSGRQYAGVRVELQGDGSSVQVDVGYRVPAGGLLDMNYVVRHRGKRTRSAVSAAGVLEENATKCFRGTIDFPRGCAGAKGSEQEDVLLLGDRQVNQTIPLILCREEDVEGNHGATIGRLDEKLLFYLGTRGISGPAAADLIARAKIEAVIERIPQPGLRERIQTFLYPEGQGGDRNERV